MTRDERRAFWLGHFEAWSLGDKSQAAYCRRHGLSPMSFSQWKRRFERERLDSAVGSAESAGAPLVEVQVADDKPPVDASGVTVAIDARVRLELSREFDSTALQRAVAALSDAGR